VREAVNDAVVALGRAEGCPPDALATIDRWLPEALVAERLGLADDGLPLLTAGAPASPGRHALGLVARDAARMLGTAERARVRICASETCSARFYDRSRGGRRRWCSMQGCGNVAKARRHRARAAS
jgi:predicted RNA-binding Zn ribbon-like protein